MDQKEMSKQEITELEEKQLEDVNGGANLYSTYTDEELTQQACAAPSKSFRTHDIVVIGDGSKLRCRICGMRWHRKSNGRYIRDLA